MEFKKVIPEEDGYYFAYVEGFDTEILRRTSECYNGNTDVCWYANGWVRLDQSTLNQIFFGDKIELPNVPKL